MKKKPFVNYTLDEDKKNGSLVIPLKMNEQEQIWLKKQQTILEQPKQSTAIKQLASIGAKVLNDEKIAHLLETVFENKRKNKRMGIIDIETEI